MTRQGQVGSGLALTACSHRCSQILQQRHTGLPADAGIGDALAIVERGQGHARLEVLTALDQMRLHHHANDALLTRGHLTTDLGRNLDLAAVVLLAVGMAAIDHQAFF